MIEQSSVVLGSSSIEPSAYVGHYSILGVPRPVRGFGRADWQVQSDDAHWAPTRGVIVKAGATIGSHVMIGDGTIVGERVLIGDSVRIGNEVQIGADAELYFGAEISSRVTLGRGVWIGGFVCNDVRIGDNSVVFGRLIHRFVDATRGIPEDPPLVEDEAFIGMGATIIGGVTVGRGSYIAAASVLTHNAERGRLYIGSPARDSGPAPKPFLTDDGRVLPPTPVQEFPST